jgi:putative transposase
MYAQAWSTDISYIKMNCGFVYLASIIDVFSRKILGYQISNVAGSELCVNALESHEKPEILNTDQGSQYTSELWRDSI